MAVLRENDDRRPAASGWSFAAGGRARLLALGTAALFVIWLARDVLGPFVVAAVLAYAFSPVVSAVQSRTRLPRVVVILLGYVLVIGVIAGLAVLAAERAGAELRELSTGGHDVIADGLRKIVGDRLVVAGQTVTVTQLAEGIRDWLQGLVGTPSNAIHTATIAIELGLQAILCLIVAFYFLLDGGRFGEFALRFLDRPKRARTLRIANHIHLVLGRWLRGQLLLIALVAVVLYVILGPILHVPYALVIAILSGVLEIIPLVGPLVAAAIAGTVAFSTRGTDVALVVLVVFFIVRQIEDQLVMPVVIGRAVHLHPVVTIFAVLVGLSVWGVLGGLLGVPVAAALNVTLREMYPDEMRHVEQAEPRKEPRRRPGALPGRLISRVVQRGVAPSQARPAAPRPDTAADAGPLPEAAPKAQPVPDAAAEARPVPKAAPKARRPEKP
jgi:predicted PurR-regulated permease PerM